MNFDPTDDDLDRARRLDRDLSDRLGLDPVGVPDRREFDRVDALADTPPGVTQPFVVRDRRGVEVLNVGYVGEA